MTIYIDAGTVMNKLDLIILEEDMIIDI